VQASVSTRTWQLTAPANGFFLISFVVEVDETLARLQKLNFGKDAIVDAPVPLSTSEIALLRDPDGTWVELIPFALRETVAEEEQQPREQIPG
jgi:hypothetical protein